MRSSTKGLELAANTIVLLLVGITMLALATGLTYTIFCGAEEYAANVDGQTENRVESLLAAGGRVQVADNTKTARQRGTIICGREPARTATFALGIQHSGTPDHDYRVSVERTSPMDVAQEAEEVQVLTPVNVRDGETRVVNILVTLPPGANEQHIYTVYVNRTSADVYGVQRIYVRPE